ncbi:MAG: thioredoxin fold domain-containing protein [Pseudomonadota bacterium]
MQSVIPGLLSSILLLSVSHLSWSQEHRSIPQTTNLQRDAELASQAGRPILLMVSQDHCTYCDLMKREVLHPMELGGDYKNRIVMREILIDMGLEITNFQGQRQDATEFFHGYGVRLTPTLLFLDPLGNELADRIVGINTVEFLNFYLDAAIDEATEKMPSRTPPMRLP